MPDAVRPTPVEPNVYDGWRSALRDGNIAITRCANCRRWQWYPLEACPACRADSWDWVNVEPTGILWSWTRVIRPTVRRENLEPPYVLALIELPQANSARVIALASASEPDPRIGTPVILEPDLIGGSPVLRYKTAAAI